MTGPDPGDVLDAFYGWLAQLGPRAPRVPGVVVEHLRALHETTISASGDSPAPADRIDDVVSWSSPQRAGAEVGYSDAHVRSLCRRGLVRHHRPNGRTLLVDEVDLQRYRAEAHR